MANYQIHEVNGVRVAHILDQKGRVTYTTTNLSALEGIVWPRQPTPEQAEAEQRGRLMRAARELLPGLRAQFDAEFPYKDVTPEGTQWQVLELVGNEVEDVHYSATGRWVDPEYTKLWSTYEGRYAATEAMRWKLWVLGGLGIGGEGRFHREQRNAWTELNGRVQEEAVQYYGEGPPANWEDMPDEKAQMWAAKFEQELQEFTVAAGVPWTANGRELVITDVD